MRGALLVAFCTLTGCTRSEETRPAPPPEGVPAAAQPRASSAPASAAPAAPAPLPAMTEQTWHFDTPFGPNEVVVLVPQGATKDAALPVLVAFHGRGESLKGPKRGARGWVQDYALGAAVSRLGAPPLTPADFGGMVDPRHLADINGSLGTTPYRGLIVVCPYLPDFLKGREAVPQGQMLARFIVEDVLPRVYRETPAAGTPQTTSVDGVSLGGRASLLVGWLRPEAFGVVAALQPALDSDEAGFFAELARTAHEKNHAQKVRLLTSTEDYFLGPTQKLGSALGARELPHRLDVVVGTHTYEFNRGPGAYEMLLFHDRALRSPAAP
jgi:enterochelin esterase-like enzyme